ncbi:aldehyde dehydrogenase family protein [Streptomyces rugosispiralis]|uniref:Aldehyde dehydrogenase family protein n=1 Tax=Streptomyces rugosispiralis TaxID=2967341 RepID=A0ABT1V910_9ACTN|nr:aldehyde dehydrogenase family protein [Streptomyces rugosispiralis]MCQ8193872.1 aldehyde dehydrogenase family protein [Streptomyces rugosispiralis]
MTTTANAPAHIDHYIDGRLDDRGAQRRGEVYHPATGQVTGRVALGTAADVDAAVRAAADAFETWSVTPSHVPARVLFRFRDLVERETDRLAAIITAEHGKVLDDAKGGSSVGSKSSNSPAASPSR